MGLRTAALVSLLATSMSACGGSKEKARELTELGTFREDYDTLVQNAMQAYSPRYSMVMDEEIRKVVEDYIPFEKIKDLRIEAYAAHLQADELDAAIRAHDHPEQAQSTFADTPEGRGFSDKIFDADEAAQQAFQNEFKERDPAIVKKLDAMNKKFDH
ncbi:hypothetical protein PHLH6_23150 [Pseudomonas sp. Seg1]|uniref:hypothetical protein n=1 Tax=Pseudomonas sp. Seg1 TaxID=2678259 RepID=UPI001BB36C91|nr:hypothetical protein [Pseudomonas sp. Seg1]BBP70311.1 hypothetical protein PHLH6_23150 [Pseudomonas sp. Seg1]